MGGTKSKSAVQSLQQSITNISSSISQTCAASVDQDQDTTATQWSLFGSNSAKVSQSTDIDFKCMNNSKTQASLQNQIANAIVNSSDSKGIALFSAFGSTKAEATVNVNNIVTTNLTISNIQQTYIAIKNKQKSFFSQLAIFGSNSVDVTQGASVFAQAVNEILDNAGVFNTITTHIDNTSSASETNPLQFLADMVNGISSSIMYVVIAIILIIAMLFLGLLFAGKSISGADEDPIDNIDESELDPALIYEDFSQ